MKYLFLDIETAHIEIEDEYIKRYLMEKDLPYDSRSMNPIYSKIIVIGLKYNNELRLLTGNEKDILTEFWEVIKQDDFTIVTHNGYKFDIPFIIVRSILNGINISKEVNLNPWNMLKSNHLDTMLIFSQNVFTNPSLRVLAKLNGINFPEEHLTGKDIGRFWEEGDLDKIKDHCSEDIKILESLFNLRCKDFVETFRR